MQKLVPVAGRVGPAQQRVWVGLHAFQPIAAVERQRNHRHERVVQGRLAAFLGVIRQWNLLFQFTSHLLAVERGVLHG